MKTSTVLVAAAATLTQATGWHHNTTLVTTVSQTATVSVCSSECPHNPTTYTPIPIPTVSTHSHPLPSTHIPVPPPGNGTIIPPGGNGTVPTRTHGGGDGPTKVPVPPTTTPTDEPGEPGQPNVPGAAALNKAGNAVLAGAGLAGAFFFFL